MKSGPKIPPAVMIGWPYRFSFWHAGKIAGISLYNGDNQGRLSKTRLSHSAAVSRDVSEELIMSCVKVPAVRHFENLAHVAGLSSALIEDHYKLYLGYVHKAHELCGIHGQAVRQKRSATDNDLRNLKRDLTFTLAAARNHELYFSLLGSGEMDRPRLLSDAVKSDFGSFDNFLSDLTRTALSTHGWVFTVLDHHSGHLINITSAPNGQFPMWNATPIIAIDMADHAYYYDYSSHRTEYLNVMIRNLNWQNAAANLQSAIDAMVAAGLPMINVKDCLPAGVDVHATNHPAASSSELTAGV